MGFFPDNVDIIDRDRHSARWRNSKGRITHRIYGVPIHRRDERGQWVEMDNAVIGDGAFRIDGKSISVGFSSLAARGADGKDSNLGNVSAVYANRTEKGLDATLAANLTAKWSVTPRGLKETITLVKMPTGTTVGTPKWYVIKGTLTLPEKLTPQGITAVDAKGIAIPCEVKWEGDNFAILLDVAALKRATFPVTIDPTLYTDGNDVNIRAYQGAGGNEPQVCRKIFYKFDITDIPDTAIVGSALAYVYCEGKGTTNATFYSRRAWDQTWVETDGYAVLNAIFYSPGLGTYTTNGLTAGAYKAFQCMYDDETDGFMKDLRDGNQYFSLLLHAPIAAQGWEPGQTTTNTTDPNYMGLQKLAEVFTTFSSSEGGSNLPYLEVIYAITSQIHFRFGKDTWHPNDTTEAAWYAAEDISLTNIPKYERLILMMGIYQDGVANAVVPRLEWRVSDGSWAEIKRDWTNAGWQLSPSKRFVEGDYTEVYLSTEGHTNDAVQWHKVRSTGDSVNLAADHWMQVAWAIHAADDATEGAVYEFRVTNAGTPLDAYTVTPTVTLETVSTPAENTTILATDDIRVQQRIRKLTLNWPQKSGTVDTATITTITDAELADDPEDYWNAARCFISLSVAGIAPQGEWLPIMSFDDANNRLTFAGFTSTPCTSDQYWLRFEPPYKMPIPYASFPIDIADPDGVQIASNWNISENDLYGAAELDLVLANDAAGTYSNYLRQRDIIRIEEKYVSTGGTSNWRRKGTFIVWEEPATWPKVSVKGSDPMSLLTQNNFTGALEGDKIHIPKKALTKYTIDANSFGFVDGSESTHTINWVTNPGPRLWKTGEPKRIVEKQDSVQVQFGNGVVVIGQVYYDEELDGPVTIDCDYYRWPLATDRIEDLVVKDVDSATQLTLTAAALVADAHIGQHVCFQSGNGRFKQFEIADNTTTTITFVAGTDLLTEGIVGSDDAAEGDRLTVLLPPMPEYFLMTVLLDGGFQASDPCGLFFIKEIEDLTTAVLMPANVGREQAYEELDETNHWEVAQEIQRYCPANYLIYCDADGNLHAKTVEQAAVADYSLAKIAPGHARPQFGTDVYTHIRYRGRDKNPINACLPANGASVINLNAEVAAPDTGYMNADFHYWAEGLNYTEETGTPTTALLAYMIDDAATNRCRWFNDGPEAFTRYDDLHVFTINLGQERTLDEIRILGGENAESTRNEIFSVNASLDNSNYWLLLDQEMVKKEAWVSFDSGKFLGSETCKYLQFECIQASQWITSGEKRVHFGFHTIQAWVLDEYIGEAILGETAAVTAGDPSFNTQADQALMGRIGDRVYTTPAVDEAANNQATCDRLALLTLNEKYREFLPLEVDGVRPDIQLRQTVTVTIAEYGISAQDYFVQSVNYLPGGKFSARLVNYRL